MPLFGTRRSPRHHAGTTTTTTTRTTRTTGATRPRRAGGLFHRKDRDRVAGGYKAALANPNTTRTGRKHAEHELHSMGRTAHVPLMTKIKRTLGIRSSPRTRRTRY